MGAKAKEVTLAWTNGEEALREYNAWEAEEEVLREYNAWEAEEEAKEATPAVMENDGDDLTINAAKDTTIRRRLPAKAKEATGIETAKAKEVTLAWTNGEEALREYNAWEAEEEVLKSHPCCNGKRRRRPHN